MTWLASLFILLVPADLSGQNNALSFDGTSDCISVPALGNGLSQFTIETWFNASAIANSSGLNGIFNTNTWNTGDVHLQINSARIELAVNGSTLVTAPYNTIILNTWHHVAVTYNSTTKKAVVYLNGNILLSTTLTTAVAANLTAAQIGAWNASRYFAGVLDEYRIWNTERTVTDIRNDMYSTLTGSETGLLLCFNFNQGTAGGTNTIVTNVTNLKGSNNGTLNTFALTGSTSNWISSTVPSTLPNNGLAFSGSNYVTYGSVNPAKFTIEAWALPTAVTSDQAIVSTLNGSTNTGAELHIGADGYPYLTVRNGGAWLDIKSSIKAIAGTWIHIAGTFNGTTASIYINGALAGSQTVSTYYPGTSSLVIGLRSSGTLGFGGIIDDVRVWSRALTAANLLDSINKDLNGTEKGLLAYYNLNQGTAGGTNTGLTTAISATGTYHGTLVSFSLTGTSSNWVTSFKPAPVSHVTSFAGSLVSNKMTLTWTDATGTVIPDGYLIYASKNNSFTAPVDGTFPSDDYDLSDGAGVARVAKGVQTFNGWTNELANTAYYFRIYPFTNPGMPVKYNVSGTVPSLQLTSRPLLLQVSIPSFQPAARAYFADVTNDGWLDHMAAFYNDGWSVLFINNRNNTFTGSGAFSKNNVGVKDWADINNDGNLDIPADGRVYLNNGNGTLFTEVVIPSFDKFCDLDNDGFADGVVYSTYGDPEINIYRENGAFVFTKFQGNYLGDINTYEGDVSFLDYNNDGLNDIIVSGRYSLTYKASTRLYKNEGLGKFTEQTKMGLEGLINTKITTGDINSDGYEDMILAGTDDNNNPRLLLYINNAGNSFTRYQLALPDGMSPVNTSIVDLDNDGLPDIIQGGTFASSSTSDLKVLKNNGDLTFTEIFDYPGLSYTPTIDLTDFNNDGLIDVVVGGRVILQNNSATLNTVPLKITSATASVKNNSVVFQWTGSDDKTPAAGLSYNLRIGKSAGAQDILSTTSLATGQRKQLKPGNMGSKTTFPRTLTPGTYYWSVQAIDAGYKGGAFSTEQSIVVDSIPASKLQATPISKNSIKIKWAKGNGTSRALFCKVGNSGSTKPINNKTYTASVTFGEGDQIWNSGWYCIYNGVGDSVTVLNLTDHNTYVFQVFEYFGAKGSEKYMAKTADGNPAIFGTSPFTKQADIGATDSENNYFAFGDYNNDGLVDFTVTSKYSSNTRLFKNKGNNTFEQQSVPALLTLENSNPKWVDFNNDGWLDIVSSGEQYYSFYSRIKYTHFYRNDKNDVFTDISSNIIPGYTDSDIGLADYDNDGDIDFVVSGTISPWIASVPVYKTSIFRNNGTSTDCFTEQTEIVLPALHNGSAKWGDFNNDGWPDLLLSGVADDGSFYLYKYQNNMNNSFSGTQLLKKSDLSAGDNCFSKINVADLNKDGYVDFGIYIGIVTASSVESDSVIIFMNKGDGTFTGESNSSFPKNIAYNNFDFGDYNNDNAPDMIIAADVNPNLIKLYNNDYPENSFSLNTDFNFSWDKGSTSFHSFNNAAFCDYDNDGDQDILVANYPNIYFLNNNLVMKSGTFTTNKAPAAPTGVTYAENPGELIVNWNRVTSDETPNPSYNVKLVTGGKLINAPGSDLTTGKRLVSEAGNAGMNNFAIFKDLPSGTYDISVQAVDGAFNGGAWSTGITVDIKNTKAFFTYDTVCYKSRTKLIDLSTSTNRIVSKKWKYRDKVVSTDSILYFTFPKTGLDTIRLVVTDSEGRMDSIIHPIKIKARPTAGFTASTVCIGGTTVFANTSSRNGSGTISWKWIYGNGETSADSVPVNKVFGIAQTYTSKLIMNASDGCADTLSKAVIVAAIPNSVISVNGKTTICSGDSVQLTAEYNPVYTYQWRLDNYDLTGASANTYKVKSGSGSFSVRVTNPVASCASTSSPVAVNTKPTPATPVIASQNYQAGKCLGELPVILKVDQPFDQYTYQWKRNGTPVSNSTSSTLEGFLNPGSYSVVVSDGGCNAESQVFEITSPGAPDKPLIYAQGSRIWYLMCSNHTANTYKWYYNGSLVDGALKYYYVARQNLGVYYVRIGNKDGCFTTSDTIRIPTGKSASTKASEIIDPFLSLNIYPNPTPGKFELIMDNELAGDLQINVISNTGKSVLKITFDKSEGYFSTNVDLSGQQKGIYLINITLGNSSVTRQLIVE